jgi:DNA-binding CsgD family transcriptional regulator
VHVLQAPIVGREPELAALQRFVTDVDNGPASLVLEGLAGIGKTAIWTQSVLDAQAAETLVRACRCGEPDAAWAFSGLGDLLDGLDTTVLAELPAVQQRALSAALLLSDATDNSPGDRVVGVAVLGVLRALARSEPLILAIDDIQWLDVSSRRVLTFALRRLDREPIRLIASCRTGPLTDAAGATDLGLPGERIVVGPVSIGSMQRIVQTRLSQTLSRPTLTRLHQATGGNPMMCLEMARALQRRGHEPTAGEPLPVPADLRVLVTERLRSLTDQTRELLLFAAGLAHPTIATVTAAVGDPKKSARCLDDAVAAGVLELDGERVRFTHPLIASIPYADLPPAVRRQLHERLAATVTDPEEHARHAALGSTERSSAVAAALDTAARRARARGSIDAAAELAELAVARTPPTEPGELLRRTVDTAKYLFLLGDVLRARAVLTQGLEAAPPGPSRVRGLLLQATIASWEQGDATVASWCEQAMAEAGDEELPRALCHATLAAIRSSSAAMDLFHAESAVRLLEAMDAPPSDLLANALTNVACNACRLGRGLAVATLERAATLQADEDPLPVEERAGMGLGMYLKVVDRFEESRTWLKKMWTAAVDDGDDSALPITLGHLATLECWAGDYDLALEYAVEGREHAARMGIRAPMPQSAHALVLAHRGRLDEARALGERDLATDDALGYVAAGALHLRSLGFTELLAGNPGAAAEHFLRGLSISSEVFGIREPAILRLHADAVAALVALERIDDAQRLTHHLDVSTAANHLPWSTAMAGRCHGLLKVVAGDAPAALELLQQALVDHQRLPMPFEEARTRLLYGSVLRRAGHRTDARRELEAARAVFIDLRTPIQAEQARAELASVGGWPAPAGTLSPVEARIAALVAGGQTNKEVASTLFMSVRTVESHLGRIYRKLGLRSRTELATRLPAEAPQS